eukprot:gene22365-28959_t
METIQNINPTIYKVNKTVLINPNEIDINDEASYEEVDKYEIFEYIRNINDPEHPLTLEALNVVNVDNITVDDDNNTVTVMFTPTIPHCSMATLIGSHQSELAINKQLNDKERVAAAIENNHLYEVVNKCINNTDRY